MDVGLAGGVASVLAAAALTPLVMRWLAREELLVPGELVYGRRFRVGSVLFGLVPGLLLAGLAILVRPRTRGDWLALLFLNLLWAAITVPLALEAIGVRLAFDGSGLHVSSPWSRARTLHWSRVRLVRWSVAIRWLVLSDGEGTVVRVSPLLSGLERFATACRHHIAPEILRTDPDGAAALELMARGHGSLLAWRTEPPSKIDVRDLR